MYRRCSDRLSTRELARTLVALSAALAVAACSSSREIARAPAPDEVETAQAESPAARTYPLEDEAQKPPADSSAMMQTQSAAKAKAEQTADTPGEASLPPEALQQFERAVAMVGSGDLAGAEQAFRALSETYPSYSGPLVNLGILQAKSGQLEEAEKSLHRALERNAQNAPAYNELGIVYRKLGRFGQADEAYTRAVHIDPSYANAYLNLGVLCDLYLQQPQRALEAFERYIALASDPDERVNAWVKELKVRLDAAQRAGAGS